MQGSNGTAQQGTFTVRAPLRRSEPVPKKPRFKPPKNQHTQVKRILNEYATSCMGFFKCGIIDRVIPIPKEDLLSLLQSHLLLLTFTSLAWLPHDAQASLGTCASPVRHAVLGSRILLRVSPLTTDGTTGVVRAFSVRSN